MTLNLLSVQQAQTVFNYKNTRVNEAVWFNKIHKMYHITRKYIYAKVSNTFYVLYVHLLL